jgi:Fe(3+) dicitrate transport protein
MKKFKIFSIILFILMVRGLSGQTEPQKQTDTIHRSIILQNISITGYRQIQAIKQLQDLHQTYIISGKKNEVITLAGLPANIAEKTGRQIFARIPGAFVYDMDGSGNQINLATRGLDPHRSWEYNVRQNGIMINSDIYGYPASHYSMPMEAVKNIELVRGTAALQYGAEFGGMINYVLKTPDTSVQLGIESIHSVGSFGLLSTYNAIGGRLGKMTYQGYFQKRVSDGYRRNSRSQSDAQYIMFGYDLADKCQLQLEIGRSNYEHQLPGPLTDSMFYADPRQSTRARNYYSPTIWVPSLKLDWQVGENSFIQWVVSGIFGDRKSVLFEGFADKPDRVVGSTGLYASRVVDIDNFNTRTSELRFSHQYAIGNLKNVVAIGLRYFNNDMRRRQRGKGTTGADYDLTVEGEFGRDMRYVSKSMAFSIENLIYIRKNLSVSPGIRYETGQTNMSGYISYLDPKDIPNTIVHKIPAFGINFQYKLKEDMRMYAGISQAYRPVLFKDIIPGSVLERANKNLKNATGYNAEIGFNGWLAKILKFDLSVFTLRYNDRLGKIIESDANGNAYLLQTNIGDSRTSGLEMYAEFFPLKEDEKSVSVFTSTSWMDAVYVDARIVIANENRNISGNRVESVPRWISRNGLNFGYKGFHSMLLYSYVSESFADPANTVIPTSNGAVGLVPAYGIWDFNVSMILNRIFSVRLGVNNIFDHQYFTKRPLFYPGPGVWSSDGRGWMVTFGVKL